jgi:hypothetical protein
MTTRISKIARLPKPIREQLNHRLENGEIGRTILPWLNDLPETKKVMAELFGAKPITHQNLSEWRQGGYRDWLFMQQRLDWFDRLTEQETEMNNHNQTGDAHEVMGNIFLFEISQALTALQSIKNPEKHWARLQILTREFARLQNAFNWSRRVELEWSKYKDKSNSNQPDQPQFEEEDEEEEYFEEKDIEETDEVETNPDEAIANGDPTSPTCAVPSPAANLLPPSLPTEANVTNELACETHALPDTEPTPGAPPSRRPVTLPELPNSQLPNSQPPPAFRTIPPLAPTPTLTRYGPRAAYTPRGRRISYIEG